MAAYHHAVAACRCCYECCLLGGRLLHCWRLQPTPSLLCCLLQRLQRGLQQQGPSHTGTRAARGQQQHPQRGRGAQSQTHGRAAQCGRASSRHKPLRGARQLAVAILLLLVLLLLLLLLLQAEEPAEWGRMAHLRSCCCCCCHHRRQLAQQQCCGSCCCCRSSVLHGRAASTRRKRR